MWYDDKFSRRKTPNKQAENILRAIDLGKGDDQRS